MLLGILLATALQSSSNLGARVQPPASPAASSGPKLDWRRRPSQAALWDAFPIKATQYGVAGSAAIHCSVGLLGELFDCELIRESPQGWGFGVAALKLAPVMLMTAGLPDKDGHRPVANVPVTFGNPRAHPTLIGLASYFHIHPHWLQAPTYSDVAAAYPREGGGSSGYVSLACDVTRRDGRLGRCSVRMEDPPGHGFGKAALSLVPEFQIEVPDEEKKDDLEIMTNLQVQFPAPGSGIATDRVIEGPSLTDIDAGFAHLFPSQAAQKGVKLGSGTAECAIGPSGALQNCHAYGAGVPPGLGFPDAAVEVAKTLRVRPWTESGQPADGGYVRLTFEFHP